MSLFNHVLNVSFGQPPNFRVGNHVTVCSVDGCMAEQLNPVYAGRIIKGVKIPVSGSEKPLPGIKIRVTDPMKSGLRFGEETTQLVERLRKLENGDLIIAI